MDEMSCEVNMMRKGSLLKRSMVDLVSIPVSLIIAGGIARVVGTDNRPRPGI